MDAYSKELAAKIESGEYFEASRAWYQAIYIGSVSERALFLVIAGMASVVALLAIMSLKALLPITERQGILISASRIDDTVPQMVPLKSQGDSLRHALQNFFLRSYVYKRESYSAADFAANYRFIQAQSDPSVFAEYHALYGEQQVNSPVSILGATGRRLVTIHSIDINDSVEPNLATVKFSTEVVGVGAGSHANWTAVLQFYYTDLSVVPTVDATTGVRGYRTQDPLFQVVHYALTQDR